MPPDAEVKGSPADEGSERRRKARRNSQHEGQQRIRSRRSSLRKSIRMKRQSMRQSQIRGDYAADVPVLPRIYLPLESQFVGRLLLCPANMGVRMPHGVLCSEHGRLGESSKLSQTVLK